MRLCSSSPQELPLDAAQPQVEVLLTGGAAAGGLQDLLQPLQYVQAAETQHGAADA